MSVKRGWMFLFGLVFFIATGVSTAALAEKDGATNEIGSGEEMVQKMCPVLPDNKINPKIFTEYKGKKVYFCCPGCKTAFLKSPEKYLTRLPQFAGSAHAAEAHGHGEQHGHHEEGLSDEGFLMSLVEPFGVATLTLLLTTACFGYFMRKKPKVLLKWHKRLAYTTVVVALSHATLVLLTH